MQILAFQQESAYLYSTLANKQELLKENKRAKSKRIGTQLLSSTRVWMEVYRFWSVWSLNPAFKF